MRTKEGIEAMIRTKEELEAMIDHRADVQIEAHRGYFPAMIMVWPFRKVIHLHMEFALKNRSSDEEVKAVLLHQLALREIPLFSVGPLIMMLGVVLIGVMAGLNMADMLGTQWIWLGVVLVCLGLLMPIVLHPYLESRADRIMQKVTAPDNPLPKRILH